MYNFEQRINLYVIAKLKNMKLKEETRKNHVKKLVEEEVDEII